jgi:2-amino-4-hydroxy-6-hydroxymethyldihydropteridine diphosphokinase
MHLAYLSLGSNIGDRAAQLHTAEKRIASAGRLIKISSFYETEPVEFGDQPWFLNCALALEPLQSPQELMSQILRIEEEMGRRRIQKKGPRSIDIDILLFDDEVMQRTQLIIPHPAMHQRRFVLEPMSEIAPNVLHPVLKKTMRELLNALPAGQIVRRWDP